MTNKNVHFLSTLAHLTSLDLSRESKITTTVFFESFPKLSTLSLSDVGLQDTALPLLSKM